MNEGEIDGITDVGSDGKMDGWRGEERDCKRDMQGYTERGVLIEKDR